MEKIEEVKEVEGMTWGEMKKEIQEILGEGQEKLGGEGRRRGWDKERESKGEQGGEQERDEKTVEKMERREK